MSISVPFTHQKSSQSPTGEIAFLLFFLWLRHIIRSSRNPKFELTRFEPGNNAALLGEDVNGSGEHKLCVNHRRRSLEKGGLGIPELLMTRLSWGRHGPKEVSISGKGSGRKPTVEKVEETRNRDKWIVQHDSPPPQIQIPISRRSVELYLKSKKHAGIDFQTDKWLDALPPPQYTTILTRSVVEVRNSDENVSDSIAQSQIPFPDAILPQSHTLGSPSPAGQNPELQSFLNSASTPGLRAGRRRKESTSSTSTLFEPSPAVPITIVVTTPDDEIPQWLSRPLYRDFPPPVRPLRRARNDSTVSLPAASSASLAASRPFPDRTRLMPPINAQVDARKLRKAQELTEIRQFLIGFLNTKGDQFPRKLRIKIMSIYGITEGDLDPITVAKFGLDGGEDNDEGIVLEHGLFSDSPENRDHLRILEMAFQSVIPIVTPTPHPAHEILRRKRTSMSSPSLQSLDTAEGKSPIAKRMSLAINSTSKTTLDSIIGKQSAAKLKRQSMPYPLKRSATVSSLPSTPLPRSTPIVILPRHKVMPPLSSEFSQRPLSRSSTMSAPSASSFYARAQSLSTTTLNAAPSVPRSRRFSLNRVQESKPVIASSVSNNTYMHYGGPNTIPVLKTNRPPLPLAQDQFSESQYNVPPKSPLRASSRPATAASSPTAKSRPLIPVPFNSHQDSSEETLTADTSIGLSSSTPAYNSPRQTHTSASNPDATTYAREPMFPQHPTVSPLKGKDANWLKVDAKQSQIIDAEQKERSKRSSIFGLVKSAFGGSKKAKSANKSAR